MRTSVVLIVVGLMLITVNTVTHTATQKTVVKYLPRDMDAWFKDPQNQPMYVYKDMFRGENIKTY